MAKPDSLWKGRGDDHCSGSDGHVSLWGGRGSGDCSGGGGGGGGSGGKFTLTVAYDPNYNTYGWGGDGHPSLFGDFQPRQLQGLNWTSFIVVNNGLRARLDGPEGLKVRITIPEVAYEEVGTLSAYGNIVFPTNYQLHGRVSQYTGMQLTVIVEIL